MERILNKAKRNVARSAVDTTGPLAYNTCERLFKRRLDIMGA